MEIKGIDKNVPTYYEHNNNILKNKTTSSKKTINRSITLSKKTSQNVLIIKKNKRLFQVNYL